MLLKVSDNHYSLSSGCILEILFVIEYVGPLGTTYAFIVNIQEVTKFYNLGDKTFEADFSS